MAPRKRSLRVVAAPGPLRGPIGRRVADLAAAVTRRRTATPQNILYIDVTPEESHAPMSWSKAEAWRNIPCIDVTPEVSHAPMSSLKDEATSNKYAMPVTRP